jgi:hypothetical protein
MRFGAYTTWHHDTPRPRATRVSCRPGRRLLHHRAPPCTAPLAAPAAADDEVLIAARMPTAGISLMSLISARGGPTGQRASGAYLQARVDTLRDMDKDVSNFVRLAKDDPRGAARLVGRALDDDGLERFMGELFRTLAIRDGFAPAGYLWGGGGEGEDVRGERCEVRRYSLEAFGRRPFVPDYSVNHLAPLLSSREQGGRFDLVTVPHGDQSPGEVRYCLLESEPRDGLVVTLCGEGIQLVEHEYDWETAKVLRQTDRLPTCPACVKRYAAPTP